MYPSKRKQTQYEQLDGGVGNNLSLSEHISGTANRNSSLKRTRVKCKTLTEQPSSYISTHQSWLFYGASFVNVLIRWQKLFRVNWKQTKTRRKSKRQTNIYSLLQTQWCIRAAATLYLSYKCLSYLQDRNVDKMNQPKVIMSPENIVKEWIFNSGVGHGAVVTQAGVASAILLFLIQ